MFECGFGLLDGSKDACVVLLFRLYHRHTIIIVDPFSSLIQTVHFSLKIMKTSAIYVKRLQRSVFPLKRCKQNVYYSAATR